MLDFKIASIILESVGTIQTKLEGPDWIDLLGDNLTDVEKLHLLQAPETTLLSGRTLKILFGKPRADVLLALSPVLPEINYNSLRRCVYVGDDGERCKRYHTIPCCEAHYSEAQMLAPTVFKSNSLRDLHRKHLLNPKKIQLDSEVALMRTMLDLMINKFKDIDPEKMPFEAMGAITTMCEKISGVIEKMSKMNQITPETIDAMMDKVVDLVGEYLPADKLREFADKVKDIRPEKPGCTLAFEPGELIPLDGADNDVTTVTQRALIDLESSMV